MAQDQQSNTDDLNNNHESAGCHVTIQRPVPRSSTCAAPEIILMTGTPVSKRKMEETGLEQVTKKAKTSTLDLAATATSGSAPGSIVHADSSPAMSPDNTARPCTPTSAEHSMHTATSTAQRPLVDPPTTPHAKPSGQPAAGSFSTPLKPSSSNIDPACTAPSQSISHRSGGASKTLETQQANESNQVTMKSRGDIANLLKHELRGAVYLHKQFFT